MFVPFRVTTRPRKSSSKVGWVIQENGCHIWQGSKSVDGYGTVGVREGGTHVVHRIRYEREIGPIPDGMVMDHFACDNPSCCNPHHVRPVWQWENILRSDSVPALYLAKTHCDRGHPLGDGNVFPSDKKKGYRTCRTCVIDGRRIRRQAKRATNRNL